jgi:apolipoprotein D and lipocalin family protein
LGPSVAACVCAAILTACVDIPEGVQPVEDFDVERYQGTWYEIARLDHSFERGLSNVTATYTLRNDGGVNVVNRGYDQVGKTWEEADGKAYFVGEPEVGRLKVSFFGPFYGAYNVIRLDDDYRWSLVAGPDRSYLWILARTPDLDAQTRHRLLKFASQLEFPVDELVWVTHDPEQLR